MKKAALVIILAVMAMFCAEKAWSEEVTTSITLRNDYFCPEQGSATNIQSFFGYWHYKSYGAGLELDYNNQGDFFRAKPYLTLDFGQHLSGLLGFNTNSLGQDYFWTGFWYINSWNKLRLVSDVRNYWSTGKQDDYLDVFVLATFPISSSWFTGASIQYDRFWQSRENWLLAGPIIGYKINDSWSIVGRLSHEWDWSDCLTEANRLRLELKTTF